MADDLILRQVRRHERRRDLHARHQSERLRQGQRRAMRVLQAQSRLEPGQELRNIGEASLDGLQREIVRQIKEQYRDRPVEEILALL